MKIALLHSELRALLAPVIPHAGTDDMLPALCTIPVATSGEHLVAQATDRFTAAFKRVKPATRPPARFAVQLQAADAKRMLNLLRGSRGTDPEISIEVTAGEVLVSSKSSGFALGFTGLDLEFATLPVGDGTIRAFPNMAGLLPSTADLDDGVAVGSFSLPFMSRFKAAIDAEYPGTARNEGVAIQLGAAPNRPMIVTVGFDFIGFVMPRRITGPGSAAVVEDWRGTIPVDGLKPPKSKPSKPPKKTVAAREAAGVEYEPAGASS